MKNTDFQFKKILWPMLVVIVLVFLAFIPSYSSAYSVMLLSNILMYIIVTVSWVIFSGPTGYISLASAAFFGVGIYTSAILGQSLSPPLFIFIGALASFILALLVGLITLRLRGMYFSIFTFGLVELIKHFLLWWEINIVGTRGRFVIIVNHATVFYYMLSVFIILLVVSWMIKNSRWGGALQGIGQEEEAAAHIGINVTMVKIVTFAVSAFFIGAAGAIMATNWTYVDPYIAFNPFVSFMPVLMAIFGGMGQLYGPIIGATVFAYLEEALITSFPYHYMLIFGIIMVVSILYLPDGLIDLAKKLAQKLVRWLSNMGQKGRKRGIEGNHENA